MSKYLDDVRIARAREKEAVAIARKSFREYVKKQTEAAHNEVLSAIRLATLNGEPNRQIGFAYGTTDPYTIKRLIAEATSQNDIAETQSHPEWVMTKLPDGTFSLEVFSIGDTGLSGKAICKIDDDETNFSAVSGDLWVQVQMYRLGYNERVVKEYYAK